MKYDFGFLTAGIGYGTNRGMAPIHKFGAHQYVGTYLCSLSKRTSLYAAYAKLSNTNFTTTTFGTGNRELDLDIKHVF